jgi:hypothetical protein
MHVAGDFHLMRVGDDQSKTLYNYPKVERPNHPKIIDFFQEGYNTVSQTNSSFSSLQ